MEQTPKNQFLDNRARYIKIFYKDFRFTPQQLADHYGMSLECVKNIVMPRGAPIDREGIYLRMNVIFPKWAKGATIVSLARQYNCSRHIMLRALRSHAEKIQRGLYGKISERNRREREAQGRKRRAAAVKQAPE